MQTFAEGANSQRRRHAQGCRRTKPETTLGRPGVQVASIVRSGSTFRLKPVEGISPPTLNGRPVGSDGVELAPGDIIEIAGTRLEFVDPTGQTADRNLAA
jgi:hypothetical protein